MNAQLSHAELHPAPPAPQRPPFPAPSRRNPRQIMIALSVCMALQMTGYVMILPLFAQRFSKLGAGVEALGESAMAYALAGTLAAPLMGALADRFGRRRLALAALAASVVALAGFGLASSASALIFLRGLAGVATAGLLPAVIGLVAGLAPAERRAQWVSVVSGGASVGWMAGPVLGGLLFDRWGYEAALAVSLVFSLAAFALASLSIPETSARDAGKTGQASPLGGKALDWRSWRVALPASLSAFAALLWVSFAVMFAWAFIEPRFMFYAYDGLGWNASRLGLVMSVYGVAMTLGEFGLGPLSDRLGRKPVILLGLALFSAQFIGLALFSNYLLIAAAFVMAGLGNALFDPALTAALLDIAPAQHQARLLGLKSTAGSLGNILGPALVVLFTPVLDARGIFLAAAGVAALTAATALAWPLGTPASQPAVRPEASRGEFI